MADRYPNRGGRNYFPGNEGFSTAFLRGGTESETEQRERRLAYDMDTLALERQVTDRMASLTNLKKDQVETALQQQVLQQSAAVLPELEMLNPTDDDYERKLVAVFRSNPYAHQHPGVKSMIQLQQEARNTFLTTKEKADERTRRLADQNRMTAESIRGNVSQLGSQYLSAYDEAISSGLDPLAANARIASRVEGDKALVQLQQAGLGEEDIADLRDEAGDLDLTRARQRLASLIPKEAFTVASRIVNDIDDRISSQKITLDELTADEREQYEDARATQRAYLRQLSRRNPSSTPKNTDPAANLGEIAGSAMNLPAGKEVAAAPARRITIRNGSVVK